MTDRSKYKGIIPAFYACYGQDGKISAERIRSLARRLLCSGVQGLYICGSSGECIYHSVEERKQVIKAVMEEVGGQMTVIAHVGCNNTKDSEELARYAETLQVDAIAAIPPIYFKLPEQAIADYWNAISAAAPQTDFFIYNIPQLAGVSLTPSLLKIMRENPRVAGVKNSSEAVLDILSFKEAGGREMIVFNGPDEQYVAGRIMGADGGIGGTYGVMPQLFLKAEAALAKGDIKAARSIQYDIVEIIRVLCGGTAHLYAMIKEVLRLQGIDIGGVRAPLTAPTKEDLVIAHKADALIKSALNR